MVGLVGAIGLVAVVGSTVSVVATAVPVVSEGCSVVVGTDMVEHCDMAGSGTVEVPTCDTGFLHEK